MGLWPDAALADAMFVTKHLQVIDSLTNNVNNNSAGPCLDCIDSQGGLLRPIRKRRHTKLLLAFSPPPSPVEGYAYRLPLPLLPSFEGVLCLFGGKKKHQLDH